MNLDPIKYWAENPHPFNGESLSSCMIRTYNKE